MEKAEALKIIKEKGYEAELINSVLMFYKLDNKPTYEEVSRVVREIGYDASYGLTVNRVGGSRHIENDNEKIAV
jgi:hypothetical protein